MANVVLEAFAAGIPVVCSRVEGTSELVRNERELQSFEVGDAAAMAERLNRFADDSELCRQVGRANAELARRSFSIEAMVDAYETLYRDLCARPLELR